MKTAAFVNKRKYTFDKSDYIQFRLRKITPEIVENQIVTLKRNQENTKIEKPVTLEDGITTLKKSDRRRLLRIFQDQAGTHTFCHFIPASGAGTRMLKFLNRFLNEYKPGEESFSSYVNRTKQFELFTFFRKLKKFPFYRNLKIISKHLEVRKLAKDERKLMITKILLYDPQFKLLSLPKALFPFHKEGKTEVLTAFDQQLRQFVNFGSYFEQAEMHMTTAKDAQSNFNDALDTLYSKIPELKKNTISVSFSHQSEQTDTVSLTDDHSLVRDNRGKVLFRPAGHGVLLSNLNALDHDIIYLSNIDNIAKAKTQKQLIEFRKLMVGKLISLQNFVFEILPKLKTGTSSTIEIKKVLEFIKLELPGSLPHNFEKKKKKELCKLLFDKLNRPIRVCAVIKNTGQPGGGPFWIQDHTGAMTMQIVEKSEINLTDLTQKQLFENATHFNPVEICCGVKDYEGKKFNLNEYCKDGDGMIGKKTYGGKPITILERPGLWNGSMYHWNTSFVAMKPSLFNPVKSINDLLKKAHQ
ncbi:DUF4301 family protein [Aquimarina sp. W85]|uniref:DUF4301 family protein n=1 Tax=Aquimarina rhodophyticola TaxID=3342246 RepID=UPI0036708CB9